MAEPKPKNTSVKLGTDVIEAARVVAALRGVTITDLLTDFLRPHVAEWEEEEISKRAAAKAPHGAPKRREGRK